MVGVEVEVGREWTALRLELLEDIAPRQGFHGRARKRCLSSLDGFVHPVWDGLQDQCYVTDDRAQVG